MTSLNTLILIGLAALPFASAHPKAQIKRQVSELRDSYDFLIAGGGTVGLTIADRLTAAFPKSKSFLTRPSLLPSSDTLAENVLVIEYGEIQYAPGGFDPPQIVFGSQTPNAPAAWVFNSLPNPDVKNKTGLVLAGQVVGGSSATNGMFFDRPSRFDFDTLWTQAGSSEFDSSKDRWDWDGLFPYFKKVEKSVTFTEPSPAVVAKYNYTWDVSAYGGTTPIYSSMPPFLWGDHSIVRAAWKEMGIQVPRECAGGDKEGLCWIPVSEDPQTSRRSHAGLGHYAAVNASRPNYDLLVRHQVTRVTYPKGLMSGPPLVEVKSLVGGQVFNVTAKNEVIISAGTLQTPPVLLRSGIGPASYLAKAGIPVVLDLPGVGSNFQDHSGPSISWNYTNDLNLPDLPAAMLDPAYAADALVGFNSTPARGPYTLAMANSALYLSLVNMTTSHTSIVDKIRAIVADGSAASFLPAEHRTNPEMIAGYKQQLLSLAEFYSNPKSPSIEVPWATGTSARLIALHPLSRGTVRLNSTAPLEQPILDFRTASNPIDFDIHLAHVRFLRKMIDTDSFRAYGAVEAGPGVDAKSDEALTDYIKDTMTFSFMHPCCTAAMVHKAKGGVVGTDLKVHGAEGLRVADMSVLPMLPSAHLSALAYAVGEKSGLGVVRVTELQDVPRCLDQSSVATGKDAALLSGTAVGGCIKTVVCTGLKKRSVTDA
ncbi:GMC oxidoreductase-like protein [Apodospora peruviana]|uniref:GMC oxidoreductase-like protein n=1 Tax=Apodospora peruviana TaxID=516989 RepID=A0AAE0HWF2_9PEZI|nr:GMC oxidoreductase-like protein [Apodospora peruviana]